MDIIQWNKGKWKFKDIHKLGFPFFHIHPYKQALASELTANLPETIDYLFVFGSSVHTWHKWWKDIDVCVVGSDRSCLETLTDMLKTKNDLIHYESVDKLLGADRGLSKQIRKEGVMLYGKD